MRHSISRSRTTWDSDLVLNHTDDQGQNGTLSTIQLSRKLTKLMSLVLGQRGQALHDLDSRNMSISESMVSFSLWDLLKISRPGVHFSELTFDAYVPNKQLCVYITLKSDLNVRESETRLFLTSRPFACSITGHISKLDQRYVTNSWYWLEHFISSFHRVSRI